MRLELRAFHPSHEDKVVASVMERMAAALEAGKVPLRIETPASQVSCAVAANRSSPRRAKRSDAGRWPM